MDKYESIEDLETRRKLAGAGNSRGVSQQISQSTEFLGRKQQPSLRMLSEDDASADAAKGKEPFYMIVGFEVSPCSMKRAAGKPIEDIVCDAASDAQEIVEGAEIVYTYDVYWQDSTIKWASRWDAYLRMPGGKVRDRLHTDQKENIIAWNSSGPNFGVRRMSVTNHVTPHPNCFSRCTGLAS